MSGYAEQYPTEEELKTIREWRLDSWKHVLDLLDYLKEIWWAAEWGFKVSGKRVLRLELHTGGWSGNESVVHELKNNVFWPMFWERSDRGGHYYFRIPKRAYNQKKSEELEYGRRNNQKGNQEKAVKGVPEKSCEKSEISKTKSKKGIMPTKARRK
ncbi:MAG: hypothetical protein PHX21_13625 [bacterium]|nr:hypothetical protein [Patescibacteria group bacterium]MDD5531052.1 hypothetical protein [bacterium]